MESQHLQPASPASSLLYGDIYHSNPDNQRRFRVAADWLNDRLLRDAAILDIGCYTGDIQAYLRRDLRYTGVDREQSALAIARSRGAAIVQVDLDRELIPGGGYDAVICCEVLEHLVAPEQMVDQIVRLLKPAGFAVISLPNECTLYHRLVMLAGYGADPCAFRGAGHKHLHLPTVNQTRRFLERRFTVEETIAHAVGTAEGTRLEFFQPVMKRIPLTFWGTLARIRPSLFARQMLYLLRPKPYAAP